MIDNHKKYDHLPIIAMIFIFKSFFNNYNIIKRPPKVSISK